MTQQIVAAISQSDPQSVTCCMTVTLMLPSSVPTGRPCSNSGISSTEEDRKAKPADQDLEQDVPLSSDTVLGVL